MTTNQDLHTLKILHHVFGGLCNFFGLMPLIHVFIGIALLMGIIPESTVQDRAPPKWLGYLFVIMGGVFFLSMQAIGILNHIAGRYLSQGIGYRFNYVVAVINCFVFPFGTALGVYSIVTYNKPENKSVFFNNQQQTQQGDTSKAADK